MTFTVSESFRDRFHANSASLPAGIDAHILFINMQMQHPRGAVDILFTQTCWEGMPTTNYLTLLLNERKWPSAFSPFMALVLRHSNLLKSGSSLFVGVSPLIEKCWILTILLVIRQTKVWGPVADVSWLLWSVSLLYLPDNIHISSVGVQNKISCISLKNVNFEYPWVFLLNFFTFSPVIFPLLHKNS